MEFKKIDATKLMVYYRNTWWDVLKLDLERNTVVIQNVAAVTTITLDECSFFLPTDSIE